MTQVATYQESNQNNPAPHPKVTHADLLDAAGRVFALSVDESESKGKPLATSALNQNLQLQSDLIHEVEHNTTGKRPLPTFDLGETQAAMRSNIGDYIIKLQSCYANGEISSRQLDILSKRPMELLGKLSSQPTLMVGGDNTIINQNIELDATHENFIEERESALKVMIDFKKRSLEEINFLKKFILKNAKAELSEEALEQYIHSHLAKKGVI